LNSDVGLNVLKASPLSESFISCCGWVSSILRKPVYPCHGETDLDLGHSHLWSFTILPHGAWQFKVRPLFQPDLQKPRRLLWNSFYDL